MRKKFCPKCGKTVEKFYRNLCKDCFLKKFSIVDLPSKIVVRECKECGNFYLDNQIANSIEEAVDIVLSELLKKPEIHSATYRIENGKIHVTLNLKIDDLEKEEKKDINLILKNITCNSCSKKAIGYYQSIIQLRAPEKLLEIALDEMKTQIDGMRKYDELAFISKIERKKEWIDVYVGSKSTANQLAKNLKIKYRAKIKISRKLIGSISGKRVYRDTILISIGD